MDADYSTNQPVLILWSLDREEEDVEYENSFEVFPIENEVEITDPDYVNFNTAVEPIADPILEDSCSVWRFF